MMRSAALSLSVLLSLAACGEILFDHNERARLVSAYNSPSSPHGASGHLPDRQTPHSGVDFRGKFGDPGIAPVDGTVVVKIGHDEATCGGGLAIHHPPFPRYTVYCHLRDVVVKPGDVVKRGDLIGTLGDSGIAGTCNPSCPIVHMELSTTPVGHAKATPGETFDPMGFSAGCFDPGKTYPTDRLVLTFPVKCRD